MKKWSQPCFPHARVGKVTALRNERHRQALGPEGSIEDHQRLGQLQSGGDVHSGARWGGETETAVTSGDVMRRQLRESDTSTSAAGTAVVVAAG